MCFFFISVYFSRSPTYFDLLVAFFDPQTRIPTTSHPSQPSACVSTPATCLNPQPHISTTHPRVLALSTPQQHVSALNHKFWPHEWNGSTSLYAWYVNETCCPWLALWLSAIMVSGPSCLPLISSASDFINEGLQPHSFLGCMGLCNIFSFSAWQCYDHLLLQTPGNHPLTIVECESRY